MTTTLNEQFDSVISPYWTQTCLGPGSLTITNSALRMSLPAVEVGHYADAQIDDYGKLARADFPWRPPLRMEVRARSSLPAATIDTHQPTHDVLCGTAGFGFWNYPFSVRGDILVLPEAVWFFYASPPSNMALVPGLPGWGWKAQVVHAMRKDTLLAALPTALATGWGRVTKDTSRAARWLQKLSGAQEAIIDVAMTAWQSYVLEWQEGEANFWVNGRHILRAMQPPTRALGFVAWLDNQYAIATPKGQLRFGTVSCAPQWLEIDTIAITPL